MQDSLLVEIRLCAANRSYELRLSAGLNVQVAAFLSARVLSSLPESCFLPQKSCILAWMNGEVLDGGKTLWECGVKNGSKLLLV